MGGWAFNLPEGYWAGAFGGNVYISNDLHISGKIQMKDWAIETPDYVFEKGYKLKTLAEVDSFVNKNKHLPEVPSAKEMKKEGVDLAELNMTLLKKVEELTLYVIDQNKQLEEQEKQINELKQSISK